MPPKATRAATTSGSSTSGSSTSTSSSSSSDSDSSSDTDTSQDSKKSAHSRSSADQDRKKKPAGSAGKKAGAGGIGTATRSRSATSASENDGGSDNDAGKKKSQSGRKNWSKSSQPKVVPKKSATAKPVSKTPPKAKKIIDTDSDSDIDDSMIYSMTKLAAKEAESKKPRKKEEKIKTKPAKEEIVKPSVTPGAPRTAGGGLLTSPPANTPTTTATPKPGGGRRTGAGRAAAAVLGGGRPAAAALSATGAAAVTKKGKKGQKSKSMFSDNDQSMGSEDEDLDLDSEDSSPTRRSRGANPTLAAGANPTLAAGGDTHVSKTKPGRGASAAGGRQGKTSSKVDSSAKKQQPPSAIKPKPDKRRTRNSSIESDGNSSLHSLDSSQSYHSLDSDSASTPIVSSKKESGAVSDKKKAASVKKASMVTPSPKKLSRSSRKKSSSASDSETEASAKLERPTTRKQTRGTVIKKSVHVTGRRGSSDSESEAEDGGGSPNKGRQARHTVPKNFKPRPQYPPIEKRSCPVPGCNSMGHLSGRREQHFTHDACPVYHNLTPEECREKLKEYQKKENSRKKALALFSSRSPLLSPSSEQKRYLERVEEERKLKDEPMSQEEEDEDEDGGDRERSLKGLTSNYDLALFLEAQAQAAEIIEDQLKGLPDVKGTKYIEMGRFEMEVWYQSPYPEDYTVLPKIYICEFCLKYMKSYSVMVRHNTKCVWKHPPGDEIYRKDKLSVFEVCGKKYKQYCQNLCLIAKSFLDHKTLYHDVEPFLFYVMTTADSEGCHIVGYFSKEKNSFLNYNVSCILTLPPYQRQGYGRLLIDFSYLLSKMEGKIGSPEKPLSDLGLISYRAYWKDILLDYLTKDSWVVADKEISIKSISEEMGIQSYDIISTLQYMGMIKYWRGKHVILKKEDVINDYLERTRRRPRDKEISAAHLKWKPYEPTAKEKRQAEQIKKKQEERQKGR